MWPLPALLFRPRACEDRTCVSAAEVGVAVISPITVTTLELHKLGTFTALCSLVMLRSVSAEHISQVPAHNPTNTCLPVRVVNMALCLNEAIA